MDLQVYPLIVSEDGRQFEFISTGKKGRINKKIIYSPLGFDDIFNVGFGDVIESSDQIDDGVVSDNGDTNIVLNTVLSSLRFFMQKNKNASIFISGTTRSRNRLYRNVINKFYQQIIITHTIFGSYQGIWQNFEKNLDFEAVVLRRKYYI